VGSGIGGLTAAALLAKAGQSVLVVERHDRVGGYAHSFRRGRYQFDSAVHLVGSCEPVAFEGGGLIHNLLTELGVRDRCDFARIDPIFNAVYPGMVHTAPGDLDEFIATTIDEFPSEAKGLRDFLQECLNIRDEARRATELEGPLNTFQTPDRFPTLMRYRRATLARVLDDHIGSPQLKAALATLWPYLGLPPSQLSFLYFATMLMSYLADGAYYCRGTFQKFADALAAATTENGGEVLLRSSVRRIRVEDGRAVGITLENGQRIDASRVISNADARQTIEELVGTENWPSAYLKRLRRMRPSCSSLVAYLATDLPLSTETACHETFLYSTIDHEQSHLSSLDGRPSWLSVTIPTLADPSLAPAGEHLMIMTTLVPYDAFDWRSDTRWMVDRMVDRAGEHFQGLSDHLSFAEGASPRTLERYTRNSEGALYGWAVKPSQVGPGRLPNDSPISGLQFAGHWTQPGAGVYGVVASGIHTARAAIAESAT
jgi:prolycopene isomerase